VEQNWAPRTALIHARHSQEPKETTNTVRNGIP